MAATATADDEILQVWNEFKKLEKEAPNYEDLRNRFSFIDARNVYSCKIEP